MPKGFNKDGTKGGFKKGYKQTKIHKNRISKALKKAYKFGTNPQQGFHNKEKHPFWKGGKWMDRGYITVLKPEHPFCDKHGYIRKSHLIMEKYLGRFLKPEEIIHHIDGNNKNNKLKNLLLTNRSEHIKIHNIISFRYKN